ncbi:SDR family NAD(P)-dependent oxidoreductase, partial [Rhizobium leguminosarum]|uniref:SDR family NAD(P)-dependent oxidoreductase n=1 Tax=Rhizobium leguminosarum TaxID=384 RepID=UPI003F9A7B23
GIGREIVRMLSERGAQVVALTRSGADVEALRGEFGCRAIQVDLADADATREAAIAALPAYFLINCAGTTELQPFLGDDHRSARVDRDKAIECFDGCL